MQELIIIKKDCFKNYHGQAKKNSLKYMDNMGKGPEKRFASPVTE